ncbi:MAG TPA: fibronectin type III-like domain-contianing protein, partial [Ferruginibacter sp.]|nr:fibronectin type III-like domain-contianing protein [Ferruginibacter sp.]
YPFGYGLSYTSFLYDKLVLPAAVAKGEKLTLNVRVTNTGKKDGEEVVQLYVSTQNKNILAPIRALKGFQRILLKAGQSKLIRFTITPEQLSLVNKDGKMYQPKGKMNISVGGGQPGIIKYATSNVLSKTVSIN